MLALRDVQRDAAGRTDKLIRERAVVPPNARHEGPKLRDDLNTELCNEECGTLRQQQESGM